MRLNTALKFVYAAMFLGLVLISSARPAKADPCCDGCYNTWSPEIDSYQAACDYDQSQDCYNTYGSTCSTWANDDCASAQAAYAGQLSCLQACGTCGA